MTEDNKPEKVKGKLGPHGKFKKNPNIKLSDILARRCAGQSYNEIGRFYGLTGAAIRAKVHGAIRLVDDTLDSYTEHKAKVLTAVEKRILDEMSQKKKLKQAQLSSLAYGFKQVYDAGRLERGLSTENIAFQEIVSQKEAIQEQIKRLEKELLGVSQEDDEMVIDTDADEIDSSEPQRE